MLNLTLKDGAVIQVPDNFTGLEAAKQISSGLARAALAVVVNGKTQDLSEPIGCDCTFEVLTFDSEAGKKVFWHTASHILAQAVKRLYPNVKIAIGPAIDNGFYYDFDTETPFTPEDFEKIEAEMNKIIKAAYPLVRSEKPRDEAIAYFEAKEEPYKVELIQDLPEDAIISFYTQEDFTDLCAGPHCPNTGVIKSFKLLSATGAYWRGDSKRKMLQRIYAIAFTKKADLDTYINRLEEAKRRDHRRLGRELDLFDFYEEGPGFPFFMPKGMILRNTLEDFWRDEHKKDGYMEIKTPIILNKELWLRSGHWDHYKDNMYTTVIDEKDYAIKPMNCPGGMLVYKRKMVSYRDLPQRMAELGLVHRHELSGALHGMMRVRCFTQDDAHLFMTPDQVEGELIKCINLLDRIYKVFGFDYSLELSTRPEDFMGDIEIWNNAEAILRRVLENSGKKFRINEGDGAFYGPKIDFHLEDAIGRTWQCGTIQLDFQMPERFDLVYVGPDGEKHRPVMIHRTALGSIERFLGILTEQYAGAFPMWLAPVQLIVLPISDKNHEYARKVYDRLCEAGFRCEIDERSEKIGYRIREAQLQKIPYMVVLGDKEEAAGEIAARDRATGKTTVMSLEDFVAHCREIIDTKK